MKQHNCGLPEELVTAFAQGELSPRRALQVARHIIGCPLCSELLGRLNAADMLLDLPTADDTTAQPSPDFWPRLCARLDDVDELASATPQIGPPRRAATIRKLALAGVTLVVLAVAVQQLLLSRFSAAAPADLLAIHRQAVNTTGGQLTPVAMRASAPLAQGSVPYVFELDGAPAVCFVYSLGGRAATSIFTARGSINLRRLHPLQAGNRRYWVATLPDGGSLLVDAAGPIWQAVISDTSPEQMLWLLRRMPSQAVSQQPSM